MISLLLSYERCDSCTPAGCTSRAPVAHQLCTSLHQLCTSLHQSRTSLHQSCTSLRRMPFCQNWLVSNGEIMDLTSKCSRMCSHIIFEVLKASNHHQLSIRDLMFFSFPGNSRQNYYGSGKWRKNHQKNFLFKIWLIWYFFSVLPNSEGDLTKTGWMARVLLKNPTNLTSFWVALHM